MVRILLATSRVDLQELVERAVRSDASAELLGVARSFAEAVTMARQLSPDIVTMELRLGEHDSVEAVREIMVSAPAPIVMVSRVEELGSVAARALDAGALAVIPAPPPVDGRLEKAATEKFLSTIKAMAHVKVVRQWRKKSGGDGRNDQGDLAAAHAPIGIVGIAASTGGPAAIRSILMNVSSKFPAPILIVQHMSSGFIDRVAASLDATVPLNVKVATDGERLRAGMVYLAPDGRQLGVSGRSRIRVVNDAPVDGFKPSGSYLFGSIARAFKGEALAVILTGMGNDGTEGLRALREAGGKAIAQDEESSVVFGMPKSAIGAGLVDFVLPLESIGGKIVALAEGRESGT
ncbi:CheB, chemotaxis response regulator containing a CheY-like receiver domain and a methylesterase domain CheB (plasmid) [Sinorhizobium fredii NGR234]|uniref:Protein-glutamate methylesterase/protein-glutamine glutaminase n=1 Tax=Sinorhizobium fredii (strain NBRC 101917 / NGR234) TaxID=394 RepID=Q6W1R5_SINFN|nr:chemotaxis protein CheB [Sinorhizobium fredii]AAQ87303.1 Protein-glutamate methylesterase [Sinorhizobium fredii NGR234]ACP21840.1 CheB, chemotaxis response regulator containing a CheY-like receiver domain and a methylesterase domain CheB [Sinorhizobium fredii NGR234]